MSAKPCSRAWQAEAVLDGLLSRADAASFERHAAGCAECSAERAALARLESLAERLPTQQVTPLRRRALHHELLRRANEISVRSHPSRLLRPRVVAPVFACLVGLLVLFLVRLPGRSSLADAGVAPAFELTAAPNSRWHVAKPGRSLRLALEGGTFAISVRKLEKAQSFALSLPDGELEVRGTRFTVECDARRTRRVVVEEGRVALRLEGHAEVSLGPGQGWPLEATHSQPVGDFAAPSTPGTEEPPSVPAPAAPPTVSKKPEVSRDSGGRSAPRSAAPRPLAANSPGPSGAPPAASASAERGAASEVPAAPSAAARDFAQAMAAFSRGDFGTAERLFHAFEQRYPQSPHGEDVLFLRALGRSRRGDASGARLLAREYLQRYPSGFRAEEARQMAREPAPRAGLAARPGLVVYP